MTKSSTFTLRAGQAIKDGKSHYPDFLKLEIPPEAALGLAMDILGSLKDRRPDSLIPHIEITLPGKLEGDTGHADDRATVPSEIAVGNGGRVDRTTRPKQFHDLFLQELREKERYLYDRIANPTPDATVTQESEWIGLRTEVEQVIENLEKYGFRSEARI